MGSNDNAHKDFEENHSEKHAGYVLITCAKPDAGGQMQIEMTYGGSPDLAHMLIDGAQGFLEQAVEASAEENTELADVRLIKS